MESEPNNCLLQRENQQLKARVAALEAQLRQREPLVRQLDECQRCFARLIDRSELKESESHYRSLFYNNHAAMLIIDPDEGAIVDANPAACTFYGWPREVLTRKRISDINTLSEEQIRRAMAAAVGKRRDHFTFRHRRADGSIRVVEVLSGPIQLRGRQLLYSIIDDITERKRMEEALRAIHEAAQRARDLTRQLLAFSRKQLLEIKIVDINRVVAGFKRLLERLLGEDIAVELALAAQPLAVKADAAQLEQVLMNLAVNARDAMPEGGTLTIETAAVALNNAYTASKPGLSPGDYAMIGVSDTGCGMHRDILSRIFEPFFTTKDKEKGTGLGLATTYGIVKQHEGGIWAHSESGCGTTFEVYLPLCPEPAAAVAVQTVQHADDVAGAATVLVVEDDAAVRRLAVDILKRGGYRVINSDSVEEAVRRTAGHDGPLHLVLTDVVMPGMKGPEVYARICARHPEAKVLYMSGYTENVIAHRGVLQENVAFIQKPFSVAGLLEKIGQLLRR